MGSTSLYTYQFQPEWLTPVYQGWFLLLCAKVLLAGFIVASLIELLLRRLGLRTPLTALLTALLCVGAAEQALQSFSLTLSADQYLQTQGHFWKLRPDMRGEIDEQLLPDTGHELIDTYALKRLAPNLPQQIRMLTTQTPIFSNTQGLRERELPLHKPAGEYRIVCLGSSWTFGLGVTAEEAFPR